MRNAKWWTVAAHEFGIHVRRKGFILATLGMPLFFAISFGLIAFFATRSDGASSIGYVDQSEITRFQPAQVVITGTLQPDITVIRYPDEAQARADTASERIDGYIVIPADYLTSGALRGVAEDSLPNSSQNAFEKFLSRTLVANDGSVAAARLERPITEIRSRTLASPREATRGQGVVLFMAPYLFGIFFFIGIFSSSSYLMTALVEEKENRVMEILATSIKPWALMAGKILGLGLLGLLQITVWLLVVVGAFLLARSQIAAIASLSVPTGVLVVAVLMFIPSYLLVAASLSTVGAAVSAVQEGQQLSGVVSILMIAPVWFLPAIIRAPNGLLATATSIFPFTAPIVMMQRVALTDVPAWQIGLSFAVVSLSAIGMMWVAGKVMRFGMLRYGKRLSLRDIGQALRG